MLRFFFLSMLFVKIFTGLACAIDGQSAVFTVSNLSSTGDGSLAQAIDEAREAGGGTVLFEPAELFAGERIIANELSGGAGIHVVGPDVEPKLLLESNRSSGYVFSASGDPEGEFMIENLAFSASVGRFANNPTVISGGFVHIRKCDFYGLGGGVACSVSEEEGSIIIEDCLFETSERTRLAIDLGRAVENPGIQVIRRCVFKGPSVEVSVVGRVVIEDCVFEEQQGPAITSSNINADSEWIVDRCSFSGQSESAITRYNSSGLGLLHVYNSTFIGGAEQDRYALNIHLATVTNCTIVGGGAGGILNSQGIGSNREVLLNNSIVVGDFSGSGPRDLSGLFSGESRGNIVGIVPVDFPSVGNVIGVSLDDVALAPPSKLDSGRVAVVPLPGSIAIDTGVDELAIDVDGQPMPFDLRGPPSARILGEAVDVGAFESLGEFVVRNFDPAGAGSLAQALAEAEAGGGGRIVFDPAVDFSGGAIQLDGQTFIRSLIIEGPEVEPPLTINAADPSGRLLELTGIGETYRVSSLRMVGAEVAVVAHGSLELRDCAFESCGTAVGFHPSAASQRLQVQRCRFDAQQSGSALKVDPASPELSPVVTIESCAFTGNRGDQGGALFLRACGDVAIDSCHFESNESNGAGGAIFCEGNSGRIRIWNSSFFNNAGTAGGAIFRSGSSPGELYVWNSTFFADTGSASSMISAHSTSFANCTFVEGGTPIGGGIAAAGGFPIFSNSLLVGEVIPEDKEIQLVDRGNLLFKSPDLAGLGAAVAGIEVSYFPLSAGSLAIDGGSVRFALDADGVTIGTDMRGAGSPRVLGAGVDVGAFEAGGTLPVLNIEEFVSNADSVKAGDPITLSWGTLGTTTTVTVEPGIGEVSANGVEVIPAAYRQTIVDIDSEWRYEDARTDLYSADIPFFVPQFDDSAWDVGRARLGYGGDGEQTIINGGPGGNRHIVSYFRQSFEILGYQDLTDVSLAISRDDGVVVYVNGVEVLRDNLPSGELRSTTRALETVSDQLETRFSYFPLDAYLFHEGENVIAVGLHQAGANTSDAGIELALAGLFSGGVTYKLTASDGEDSVSQTLRVKIDGLRFSDGRDIENATAFGEVFLGDIDNDGDIDAITGRGRFAAVENLGYGEMVDRGTVLAGGSQLVVWGLVDVDGDGSLDLFSSDFFSTGYFPNEGGLTFGEKVVLPGSVTRVGAVEFVDLDGDGDEDALVAADSPRSIGYFENLGEAGFAEYRQLISRGKIPASLEDCSVMAGDFDGDSHIDVVFSIRSLTEFRGGELFFVSGVFQDQSPKLVERLETLVSGPLRFEVLDHDGDGVDDLLAHGSLNQDGDGGIFSFSSGEWQYKPLFDLREIFAVADFNLDGRRDVLSSFADGLMAREFRGAEGEPVSYLVVPRADIQLRNYVELGGAADIDQDGDLDFIHRGGFLEGGKLIVSENLIFNDPLVLSFSTDLDVVEEGGEATLSWHVELADRIELDGEPVGAEDSVVVRPNQTRTYELVVYRDANVVSQPITIRVLGDVELAVNASESIDPVLAGHAESGAVEHVFTVNNDGLGIAEDLILDVGSEYPVGVSLEIFGGAVDDGRWRLGDLGPGEMKMLILRYTADESSPGGEALIQTSAGLASEVDLDSNPGNDHASLETAILSPAEVIVELLDAELRLNLQTGLFEQRLRLTNGNHLALPGVLLGVSGLPEGVAVRNGQDAQIFYAQELDLGGSVVLTVEFESSDRDPGFEPEFDVGLMEDGGLGTQPVEGDRFAIDRLLVLADGTILIEWPAIAGAYYQVEYSEDMVSWADAGPAIKSGGNRMQWNDHGPPETRKPPSEGGVRFYRIVRPAAGDRVGQ